MPSLSELMRQKKALEAKIAAAKKSKLSGVIKQIKALVEEYELSPADIFSGVARGGLQTVAAKRTAKGSSGKRAKGAAAKGRARKPSSRDRRVGKVAPKYRDPATGATWTGRGIAPKWIADKDRSKYLISAS